MKEIPLTSVIVTGLSIASGPQLQARANQHAAGVDSRGDHAMGFSHDKTTHHFRLLADGGSIEVLAINPSDSTSREEIQMHLAHIVSKFRDNDFDIPMFIHERVPPGVPVMKQKRALITYMYEPTETGGLVQSTSFWCSKSEIIELAIARRWLRQTGEIVMASPGS
jgi:hypothetical protein